MQKGLIVKAFVKCKRTKPIWNGALIKSCHSNRWLRWVRAQPIKAKRLEENICIPVVIYMGQLNDLIHRFSKERGDGSTILLVHYILNVIFLMLWKYIHEHFRPLNIYPPFIASCFPYRVFVHTQDILYIHWKLVRLILQWWLI